MNPEYINFNSFDSQNDEGKLMNTFPPLPPSIPSACECFYDYNQTQYGKILGHGATGKVCEAKVATFRGGVQCKPTSFAVKILKSSHSSEKAFYREKAALQSLVNIPTVVKLHTSKEGVIVDGKVANIMYLEHCSRGEYFNILEKFTYGLPEQLARHFAKEIWSSVASCHNLGVQHRDIKPENILVSEDWSIRLADFGSALTGYQTQSIEYCGTEQYIAPEVSKAIGYSPMAADVWSTAVTIFITLYGIPPFFEATNKCWYFRCVRDRKWNRFWTQQEKARPDAPVLSKQAKAFLERALDPNPHTRPSALDMLDDEWLTDDDAIVYENKMDIDEFIQENSLQ